jgi:hypothetical protein
MATLAARAIRGAQARDALSAKLGELGKRLDVTLPAEPPRSPDPDLQPILVTEWQVAVLDALVTAVAGLASSGEAPAGYDALTVTMLREEIARRGIDRKASKKADLIAILEESDAAPEGEQPDGDESEDEEPGAEQP